MRAWALIVLSASVALGGCEPEPAADVTAAPAKAAAAARPKPSDRDDMVAAVSAAGARGLVDLHFSVTQRPRVGEPVSIELALTPAVELEHLFARFQVAEGLELLNGAETARLESPARGTPIAHTVTVVPKADGIFYVTAVVLADSSTESIARTYTIPLIAGNGIADLPAAPPAASTADLRPSDSRE